MEHSRNLADVKLAAARHTFITKLIRDCFYHELNESSLNLGEYLTKCSYIIYEGERFGPNRDTMYIQEESYLVPEKYIKEAYSVHEDMADCKEWIRIWSNYCSDFADFIAGMPGESNEFSCEELTEKWKEMAQGEAFADLEGRIFAHKLLKGAS